MIFQVGIVNSGDFVIVETSPAFEAIWEVVIQACRDVYPSVLLLFYSLY